MTDQLSQSILFVCWANVYRSPVAASMMRRLNTNSMLFSQISSAGVCPAAEMSLPLKFRLAGIRRGLLWRHQPRLVNRTSTSGGRLVVAMDRRVLQELKHLIPKDQQSNLSLFTSFASGLPKDVPDPAGRLPTVASQMFEVIERGCSAIAKHFQESQPDCESTLKQPMTTKFTPLSFLRKTNEELQLR